MTTPEKRFYYGWVIVAIGFCTMLLVQGSFASSGVLFAALTQEYGWSRATTSPLFRGPGRVCLPHLALRPLIRPLWATPVVSNRRSESGPRLNPERSDTDALASVSDLGVLVGQGLNLIGFVPHLTQMSLWFHRRRGLASGLVLSGASMGTLILVPGAQYLVNGYGWRLAYTVLGLLVLVCSCL